METSLMFHSPTPDYSQTPHSRSQLVPETKPSWNQNDSIDLPHQHLVAAQETAPKDQPRHFLHPNHPNSTKHKQLTSLTPSLVAAINHKLPNGGCCSFLTLNWSAPCSSKPLRGPNSDLVKKSCKLWTSHVRRCTPCGVGREAAVSFFPKRPSFPVLEGPSG